jgi:membrane-associated phospholipid phosphatase
MRFTTFISSLAATAAAVTLCVLYLDIPLARACRPLFRRNSLWGRLTADIPDLLQLAVVIITVIFALLYFYRVHRRIFNRFTWFCLLTACAVPVSFALKALFKFLFGRVNARYWLSHPDAYRFDWLHGSGNFSGLPSGHMAVYAALAACIWSCYPRYRPHVLLGGLALSAALIATNYHFLGDVVAGVYLGVCVAVFTARLLERKERIKKEES